jgi:hypothetical protein
MDWRCGSCSRELALQVQRMPEFQNQPHPKKKIISFVYIYEWYIVSFCLFSFATHGVWLHVSSCAGFYSYCDGTSHSFSFSCFCILFSHNMLLHPMCTHPCLVLCSQWMWGSSPGDMQLELAPPTHPWAHVWCVLSRIPLEWTCGGHKVCIPSTPRFTGSHANMGDIHAPQHTAILTVFTPTSDTVALDKILLHLLFWAPVICS